jgi:hypothetical protein
MLYSVKITDCKEVSLALRYMCISGRGEHVRFYGGQRTDGQSPSRTSLRRMVALVQLESRPRFGRRFTETL